MARITPLHVVPALLAAATHAGEITVESAPFHITHHVHAQVVPVDPLLIRPEAKLWKDFRIVQIAAHGSRVETGDLLVRFDPTSIEREMERLREVRDAGARAARESEMSLRHLNESAPLRQAALKLAAVQAKQNADEFTTSGRKVAEERVARKIGISQKLLGRQREELAKLVDLHEAGKTSDKYNHPLVLGQLDEVSATEFTLRMETLDLERTVKVLLPRQAEELAARQRESELALRHLEEEIQQQLALKKSELESAKDIVARAERDLTLLETDRALFEISAPSAGWLCHGTIGGTPTTDPTLIATFVPVTSKVVLVAHVPEASGRTMAKDLEGIGSLTGQTEPPITVKVLSVGEVPSAEGNLRIEMSANWPEGIHPAPSSGMDIHFISHRKAAAIAIPSNALSFGPGGWTVEVKLAEGNTEPRPVKPGLNSGTVTEILGGLEPGQVIRVPHPEP